MRALVGLLIAIVLMAVPAKADTINHVDALGSFFDGRQTFQAAFDWDVDTNSMLENSDAFVATGVYQGLFSLVSMNDKQAIWQNENLDNFQIDFRNYWPNVRYTFGTEGDFGTHFLEFYSGGGFWQAQSGHLTIVDPPQNVPEPTTFSLLATALLCLCGLVARPTGQGSATDGTNFREGK